MLSGSHHLTKHQFSHLWFPGIQYSLFLQTPYAMKKFTHYPENLRQYVPKVSESSFNQQIIWWHRFTITPQWNFHTPSGLLFGVHTRSFGLLRHPGHHMIVKGIWPDLHWVGQEAGHLPQQAQQAGLSGPRRADGGRHRSQIPLLCSNHELKTASQVFLELLFHLWWELSSHHIPASRN